MPSARIRVYQYPFGNSHHSTKWWREGSSNLARHRWFSFLAIVELTKSGINIRCADDQVRKCYPYIHGVMVDYPEQVKITGVKGNYHCPICQIPSDQRENMTGSWPLRTHKYTQDRLEYQKERDEVRVTRGSEMITNDDLNADGEEEEDDEVGEEEDEDVGNLNIKTYKSKTKIDPMDIHARFNFAWNHSLVNIHTAILPDLLHDCMKGMIMRIVEWVKLVIKNEVAPGRLKKRKFTKKMKLTSILLLDRRFRQVPSFPGMKKFKTFSKVSQWTEAEQKQMLKQLVVVLTSLLRKTYSYVLHCVRVVLDFVMLTNYNIHDETTLEYMKTVIYRINKFKTVFKKYRPWTKNTKERDTVKPEQLHFNISKFHAITHFSNQIRRNDCSFNYSTNFEEFAHKTLLKQKYELTNKNQGYEIQILKHNIRDTKIMTMRNLIRWRDSRRQTQIEKSLKMTNVTSAEKIKPIFFSKKFGLNIEYMRRNKLNAKKWRIVQTTTAMLNLNFENFRNALAVFVRENRKRSTTSRKRFSNIRRDMSSNWVNSYYIVIFESVHCWASNEKDDDNNEKSVKHYVKSARNWRKWTKRSCLNTEEF